MGFVKICLVDSDSLKSRVGPKSLHFSEHAQSCLICFSTAALGSAVSEGRVNGPVCCRRRVEKEVHAFDISD
jgi:hypothetical protein